MDEEQPVLISNAEFTGYEEEDIDRLTAAEHDKLRRSPSFPRLEAEIENELGPGYWEEHWVTLDESGRRVYAHVYYGDHHVRAVTAAGDVVRDFGY